MKTVCKAGFEKKDFHGYNQKSGYGLTKAQQKMWTLRHKNGTPEQKLWIENMLTDINFHHECSLLAWGKYDQLLKEIKEKEQ